MKFLLLILTFLPAIIFASRFEEIENRVFSLKNVEELQSLKTEKSDLYSAFQNALVLYRIGN
ncbi:MAG: hypothetical protein D6707_12995, partial [Bacteroidetes bacterium]